MAELQPILSNPALSGAEQYGDILNPASASRSKQLARAFRTIVDAMGGPVSGRMVEHSTQQRQRMAAGDYSPTRPTGESIDLADSVAGGLLGTLKAGKLAAGIRAYHGSPHRFDRFDMSKIGTGEGAQAYGHGLYFAEAPGTARSYMSADGIKPKAYIINGKRITNKDNQDLFAAADYKHKGMLEAYRDYLLKKPDDAWRRNKMFALRDIEEASVELAPPTGNFYTTRLDVEPEDLLDWDAPLSQQSEKVRAALEPFIGELKKNWSSMGGSGRPRKSDIDALTGERLYRALGWIRRGGGDAGLDAQAGMTAALREAGIPGIRYLDQGSRTSGDGTRNFVIFDDKLIDITHVDGKPLTKAERKAAIAAMLAGGMGAMGVASTAEAGDAPD